MTMRDFLNFSGKKPENASGFGEEFRWDKPGSLG
jgi:hypothetical protein